MFLHSSLELGMFLEETTFSSLPIRPATNALQNAFHIGLTWILINYKAGQGIYLKVRS